MGVYSVLAGLVATVAISVQYASFLEVSKEVPPTTAGCERINPEFGAVEDFVTWREGVLIGGVGDIIKCEHEGPESVPPGYLIALDVRGGSVKTAKLKLLNTPKVFTFHPHGLSFSRDTNRLYVVNHGGVSTIGTRIEVFSVMEDEETQLPIFTWVMAVGDGHRFGNMALNSVVETAENEIYVTQWQNAPVPDKGSHHPVGVLERLGRLLQTVVQGLAWKGFTGVYRCVFDIESKSTIQCRWAAYGFVHANGITTDQRKTTLWIVDPLRKELRTFNRNPSSGELTESPDKRIPLHHAVDNVHYDETTGELWMGCMRKIAEPIRAVVLKEKLNISGAFHVARPQIDGTFILDDEINSDGSVLNWISGCANVYQPNHREKKWSVCGSPLQGGILVCKRF